MRPSDIYQIEPHKAFVDSSYAALKKAGFEPPKITVFHDASPGILQRRSLEIVDPNILKVVYPDNAFLNSGIGINNFGGWGESITSLRTRVQGGFTKSSAKDSDKGRISLSGERSNIQVAEFDTQELWTETEAMQAKLENRNIVSEYVQTTDAVYKETLDRFYATGIDDVNGLLNHSDITPVALSTIGGGTALADYELVKGFILTQWNDVNNVSAYMGSNLIMPFERLNILNTRHMDTSAGNGTVLEALKKNFPTINFMGSNRCDDVGGTAVMSLYSSDDKVVKFRLPIAMKRSKVFIDGFKFKVDVMFRAAGIDLLEPSGLAIGTGI